MSITVTAAKIEPSHIQIGRIKIALKTGEVEIPEDMEMSEAAKFFWDEVRKYASNS
jgi:hypothetical protein